MSTTRRRAVIKALREEGAAAFRRDEPRTKMLIGMLMADRYHWNEGWDGAQYEDQNAADDSVTDNDSDLAIAIGEHAFNAGFQAALRAAIAEGFHYTPMPGDRLVVAQHAAWSDYAPPEELCGRSFAKLVTVRP